MSDRTDGQMRERRQWRLAENARRPVTHVPAATLTPFATVSLGNADRISTGADDLSPARTSYPWLELLIPG